MLYHSWCKPLFQQVSYEFFCLLTHLDTRNDIKVFPSTKFRSRVEWMTPDAIHESMHESKAFPMTAKVSKRKRLNCVQLQTLMTTFNEMKLLFKGGSKHSITTHYLTFISYSSRSWTWREQGWEGGGKEGRQKQKQLRKWCWNIKAKPSQI